MSLIDNAATAENPPVGESSPAEATTVAAEAETTPSASSETTSADLTALSGAEPAATATPTNIPENWRELLAGQDKAALNVLSRLPSFEALGKKLMEQERLITAGKHKQPLAEGASEEDVAAWREQNGIPSTPEGYLEKIEGLVVGEEDKADVQSFLKVAHEANADPKFVQSALKWHYEQQAEKVAAQAQADREFREAAVTEMQQAMGPDYVPNMQDLRNWLGQEEGIMDLLVSARLSDGTLMGDNPKVLGFLVRQMREINPMITVTPGSGVAANQSIEDQINEFDQMMRTAEGRDKYWGDPKLQQRYNELLNAQIKMEQRKSA